MACANAIAILAIIGAVLIADVTAATYSMSSGIKSKSLKFVDGPGHKISVQFTAEGSVKPGSSNGLWKITAYGSKTNNPNQDGGEQLLSEADSKQGDSIKFTSNPAILDGITSCPGFKEYVCYTLKRGAEVKGGRCYKLSITCTDDLKPNKYSWSFGAVPRSVGFVDNTTDTVKLKFFVKGNFPPEDSGSWKMSAYGSGSNSPNGVAEVDQILSDDDINAGDDVDFISNEVVLTGLNGCNGGDNYACFTLRRGTKTMVSKCIKLNPDCGGGIVKPDH